MPNIINYVTVICILSGTRYWKSLSITDKVSAGTPWLSSPSRNGMHPENVLTMQIIHRHKDDLQFKLNELRSLDVHHCKILVNWLLEHIKVLESDNELHQKSINTLQLTPRTRNVLRFNNIHTIGSLVKIAANWDNVKVLKGAGKKVLTELDHKIQQIHKGEIS